MADKDSTSNTEKTIAIDCDSFNKATLMLSRAHGILDALFTLTAHGTHEELMEHSLTSNIDAAMVSIKEAQELLIRE
ncbi:hypothetical protein [Nitrosomonas oligotropha]|uniref:hypothetical protein n=1 Tax=Nitrosomonas oligotropha TaxID=42354 RepID=UPI00136C892C|nr:hypothetical protein [Nitrosomonas oligotropha]MXS83646.1 hypothetical protein [Nitrosomonas oligotropha]